MALLSLTASSALVPAGTGLLSTNVTDVAAAQPSASPIVSKSTTPRHPTPQRVGRSLQSTLREARRSAMAVHEIVTGMIGGTTLGEVDFRIKASQSARDKVWRKLTPEDFASRLEAVVRHHLPDILGFRLVLFDGDRDAMDALVTSLVHYMLWNDTLFTHGDIVLNCIQSHYADTDESLAYWQQPQHSQRLRKRFEKMGLLRRGQGFSNTYLDRKSRENGYTGLNMMLRIQGIPVELQVRGELVHQVAEAEHSHYKARTTEIKNRHYNRLRHVFTGLSEEQFAAYEAYVKSMYLYARMTELCRRADASMLDFPESLAPYTELLKLPTPCYPAHEE